MVAPIPVELGPDPNWLPATVATCSAALVAIVGGLFGGRIVASQQEHHERAARYEALHKQIATAEGRRREAEKNYIEVESRLWIARVLRDLVAAEGWSEVSRLMRRSRVGLTADLVRPVLERYSVVVRQTLGALKQANEPLLPKDWVHARTIFDLGRQDPFEDRVAAETYIHFYRERMKQHPEEKLDVPLELGSAEPIAVGALEPPGILADRLSELSNQIGALKGQLEPVRSPKISSYKGLAAGLSVATAAGVFFPLIVLALQLSKLDAWLRVGLVAAGIVSFSGVVIALLAEAAGTGGATQTASNQRDPTSVGPSAASSPLADQSRS